MKAKDAEKKGGAWRDPIVEEIHATRARHAREFDYDIEAIVEDLQRRQKESEREVVSFPPKRVGETHIDEGLA